MRLTRLIMGMPVTVEICGEEGDALHAHIFEYLEQVDRRFSPFRADSELARLNAADTPPGDVSDEMREVLGLAELTRTETDGYFDILRPDGLIDPSGIVKGWAIRNAARRLSFAGCRNYFVDAGGDIQSAGVNGMGEPWRAGIQNPFSPDEVVKHVYPQGRGIATSGTYVRGQHIYDPHRPGEPLCEVVSLTVIGHDVLEADRFATAAFAMGRDGIGFIEERPGLEGYQIDRNGIATMTSGFSALTQP